MFDRTGETSPSLPCYSRCGINPLKELSSKTLIESASTPSSWFRLSTTASPRTPPPALRYLSPPPPPALHRFLHIASPEIGRSLISSPSDIRQRLFLHLVSDHLSADSSTIASPEIANSSTIASPVTKQVTFTCTIDRSSSVSLSSRSFFFSFIPSAMASSSNHMRKKEVCNCKEEAPLFTSWTAKNTGRKFHGCPNFKDKTKDCKYFTWVEEEPTIETYKDCT
ncbi:hypothetical protein LXL04_027891 [Taraxacum kok-saghyz]